MEKEPETNAPVVSRFALKISPSVTAEEFEPFIPACCGCKYHYTETEQDGWEYPPYIVPCCNRPKGRGENGRPRLLDGCILEDWMVDYCRHRRVK